MSEIRAGTLSKMQVYPEMLMKTKGGEKGARRKEERPQARVQFCKTPSLTADFWPLSGFRSSKMEVYPEMLVKTKGGESCQRQIGALNALTGAPISIPLMTLGAANDGRVVEA
jgi:hypothetical protein